MERKIGCVPLSLLLQYQNDEHQIASLQFLRMIQSIVCKAQLMDKRSYYSCSTSSKMTCESPNIQTNQTTKHNDLSVSPIQCYYKTWRLNAKGELPSTTTTEGKILEQNQINQLPKEICPNKLVNCQRRFAQHKSLCGVYAKRDLPVRSIFLPKEICLAEVLKGFPNKSISCREPRIAPTKGI